MLGSCSVDHTKLLVFELDDMILQCTNSNDEHCYFTFVQAS